MNTNTGLSVLAVVLAAVALVLAVMAFNRTSEDNLVPIVEEQVEAQIQQLFAPAPLEPAPDEGFEDDGFEDEGQTEAPGETQEEEPAEENQL